MHRALGRAWPVGGAVQAFPLFSAIMVLTIIMMSDPVVGVRSLPGFHCASKNILITAVLNHGWLAPRDIW